MLGVLRFSHSRLKKGEICPRAAAFVDGDSLPAVQIDPKVVAAQEVGTLTHETIKRLLAGREHVAEFGLAEVEAAFEQECNSRRPLPAVELQRDSRMMLNRWRVGLSKSLVGARILAVEKGFRHTIADGVEIVGVFDLVVRTTGGTLLVVEWKSGSRRGGHEEQVILYAIAAQAEFAKGRGSVEANIYEFDSSNVRSMLFDTLRIELETTRLERRIRALSGELAMTPVRAKPGWMCPNCAKLPVCPEGSSYVANSKRSRRA